MKVRTVIFVSLLPILVAVYVCFDAILLSTTMQNGFGTMWVENWLKDPAANVLLVMGSPEVRTNKTWDAVSGTREITFLFLPGDVALCKQISIRKIQDRKDSS